MKRFFTYAMVLTLVFSFAAIDLYSQINLRNLKKRTERKVEKRVEKKIDEKIDEKLDDVEDAIDGKEQPQQQQQNQRTNDGNSRSGTRELGQSSSPAEQVKSNDPTIVWNKFDFVPGDKVIFEDGPSSSERNGEFPSRWDLVQGQVEIMNFNGENVIGFLGGTPTIIPYLKDSDKDYLPEVFTVEFDIYRPASGNRFMFFFHDTKNQRRMPQQRLEINLERADYGDITSSYDSGKDSDKGNWMRVSIAYTKGQLRVYIDENRVLNIPRTEKKPTGISIQPYWANNQSGKIWYLKNFRIAEGGVPYYERAMQDGKIIVTGIRFDVGKATLRPESMGPINEILHVMNQDKDLRFSVEGHTDSDGNEANNQKLSEDRAKAVMDKLIELGINPSRLKYLGFGQSKPMADNSSPEGKAQNRRVEFVKF